MSFTDIKIYAYLSFLSLFIKYHLCRVYPIETLKSTIFKAASIFVKLNMKLLPFRAYIFISVKFIGYIFYKELKSDIILSLTSFLIPLTAICLWSLVPNTAAAFSWAAGGKTGVEAAEL